MNHNTFQILGGKPLFSFILVFKSKRKAELNFVFHQSHWIRKELKNIINGAFLKTDLYFVS